MKKRSLMILPLAAAFALAGCSNAGDGGSTDSAPEGTQAEQDTQTEETTQGGSGSGETLDGAQVKAVVEALVEGKDGAQVLDGDTIAASLPQAQAAIEAMNIEPAQCAELISQQGSWDVEGINMAVATVVDGTDATSYSVASYEDDAKLAEARTAAESKDMQGCDSFSMEAQGQKLEASAELLDASSDAEVTLLTKTNISMDGVDVPMNSISIQAIDGRTAVSVSASGDVSAEQELIDSLIAEVNKALAEVAKVQ